MNNFIKSSTTNKQRCTNFFQPLSEVRFLLLKLRKIRDRERERESERERERDRERERERKMTPGCF